MVFYIKQNATLPTLKMKLIRDTRYDYKKFESLIENAQITFSMKSKKGIYKIANAEADIQLVNTCDGDAEPIEIDYFITYRFREEDTDTPGVFYGEFNITFFDFNGEVDLVGKLIMPIHEPLEIHILDSFIRVDVQQV